MTEIAPVSTLRTNVDQLHVKMKENWERDRNTIQPVALPKHSRNLTSHLKRISDSPRSLRAIFFFENELRKLENDEKITARKLWNTSFPEVEHVLNP